MRRTLVIGCASTLLAMCAAGTASAGGGDDRIVLRPGDGITFSAEPTPGWCSVAAIGHDAGGRLVAVTAGHCHQTGSSPVWKVDEQHRGPIGTESEVASTGSIDLLGMPTDEIADYAVLVLDETRVRGSNTSAPNDRNERVVLTSIGGLDGGAEIVGKQCAAGRSTSVACTIADEVLVGEDLLASSLLMRPGDSGGPLVRAGTGEWIGLSVGYRFDDITLPDIPLEAPRWGIYQRADRIVAELDERGGVGAGFRLVDEP